MPQIIFCNLIFLMLAYNLPLFINCIQKYMSFFCNKYQIFNTNSVLSFYIDSRFNREDHTRFCNVLIDRTYISVFMIFLSDKMTKTDLPVLTVSCLIDQVSRLCINITETYSRFDYKLSLLYRCTNKIVNRLLFLIY